MENKLFMKNASSTNIYVFLCCVCIYVSRKYMGPSKYNVTLWRDRKGVNQTIRSFMWEWGVCDLCLVTQDLRSGLKRTKQALCNTCITPMYNVYRKNLFDVIFSALNLHIICLKI